MTRRPSARRSWTTGAPVSHDDIPFENPPAAAVIALPFSLLGAGAAWRAWSLLQLALMALALLLVTRAAPWPASLPRLPRLAIVLVALAGFGTGLLFLEGQWDGVSVLGLACAYAFWRRDRPGAAGFALGFTAAIAKPQLVIGIAAYMIGRRDWRALVGSILGAAVSVAIGLIGAGPEIAGLVPDCDCDAEQLAHGADAGHEWPLRLAPRARARRIPARRGRGDRGGSRRRLAGNGRSSAARSLRAVALRGSNALALRLTSPART